MSSEECGFHGSAVLQVRQKMYTTSVGRWRAYGEQLRPVVQGLQDITRVYEERWGLQQSGHEEL